MNKIKYEGLKKVEDLLFSGTNKEIKISMLWNRILF